MVRFLGFIATFFIGYLGYKHYIEAGVHTHETERVIANLTQETNAFCACSISDSDCLQLHIQALKKNKKKYDQLLANNAQVTSQQQLRIRQLFTILKECHQPTPGK